MNFHERANTWVLTAANLFTHLILCQGEVQHETLSDFETLHPVLFLASNKMMIHA